MTELGGCKVTAGSDPSLEITAQFLGCDKTELNAALVSRMMQTPLGGRRGSSIMYVYTMQLSFFSCELCGLRDNLVCQDIICLLFHWSSRHCSTCKCSSLAQQMIYLCSLVL